MGLHESLQAVESRLMRKTAQCDPFERDLDGFILGGRCGQVAFREAPRLVRSQRLRKTSQFVFLSSNLGLSNSICRLRARFGGVPFRQGESCADFNRRCELDKSGVCGNEVSVYVSLRVRAGPKLLCRVSWLKKSIL